MAKKVVLIVLDTTSKWNWSLYGYERRTTPVLEEWVERTGARVFRNAWSSSGWTIPAMASIYTGLSAREHGVLGAREDLRDLALPEDYVTLAQLMQQGGFRTVAVVCNYLLHPELGWDRGFATYVNLALESAEVDLSPNAQEYMKVTPETRAAFCRRYHVRPEDIYDGGVKEYSLPFTRVAVQLAREYLMQTEEPLFLLLNLMECHVDYNPFGERALGHDAFYFYEKQPDPEPYVLRYDMCTWHQDRILGGLLWTLVQDPEALVIITADHGEVFGVNGHWEHALYIGPEVTNVPLVVKLADWCRLYVQGDDLLTVADLWWCALTWADLEPDEPTYSWFTPSRRTRERWVVDGTWHYPHLGQIGHFSRADWELVVTPSGYHGPNVREEANERVSA